MIYLLLLRCDPKIGIVSMNLRNHCSLERNSSLVAADVNLINIRNHLMVADCAPLPII